MGKKKTLADMPHLPLKVLGAIEALEDRLQVRLRRCDNYSQILDYLRTYAVSIFDQVFLHYTNFPALKNYWREAAEEQAITRVLAAYNSKYWNTAHPLPDYEKSLRQTISNHVDDLTSSAHQSGASAKPADPKNVRRDLLEQYRAKCPNAGIFDICWAASQTYREWSRWLKGELKDGSKADRSFRQVLTSGKEAKTLRREPRPKGWK